MRIRKPEMIPGNGHRRQQVEAWRFAKSYTANPQDSVSNLWHALNVRTNPWRGDNRGWSDLQCLRELMTSVNSHCTVQFPHSLTNHHFPTDSNTLGDRVAPHLRPGTTAHSQALYWITAVQSTRHEGNLINITIMPELHLADKTISDRGPKQLQTESRSIKAHKQLTCRI